MKREILFRGKRSHDEAWIEGNLIIDDNKESHIVPFLDVEEDGHHLRIDSDMPVFFIQETIGQFTGLTDKNGVKIFEGDILIIDNTKMVVKFDNSCFNVIGINRNYINCLGDEFKAYCDRMIVIGNIYDNDTN